jgi:orotate phosphoribosyltransferase
VLQYPEFAGVLGRDLATRLRRRATENIDVVISPALGGLIIGHETARSLGVRFLFAERDADRKMSLRRGFSIKAGERIAVVEDVITTGGSTREVMEIVDRSGGIALIVGSIIDRSGGDVNLGVPRVALETLIVAAYEPERCPMCAAGEPLVKPGSRPA